MALMTVRAAAEKLGVGYSTMKRWIGDGRVRTTLTEGGHHRISDVDIHPVAAKTQFDLEPGQNRQTQRIVTRLGLDAERATQAPHGTAPSVLSSLARRPLRIC